MSKRAWWIATPILVLSIFITINYDLPDLVYAGVIFTLWVGYAVYATFRDEKEAGQRLEENVAIEERQHAEMLANSKNLSYETALELAIVCVRPLLISENSVREYEDYWVFECEDPDDPDDSFLCATEPCVVNRHTGEAKLVDEFEIERLIPFFVSPK